MFFLILLVQVEYILQFKLFIKYKILFYVFSIFGYYKFNYNIIYIFSYDEF